MTVNKIYGENWTDYELIDAGNNLKLERWGNVITIRPERQAYFKSEIQIDDWRKKAHLEFISEGKQTGKWIKYRSFNENDWKLNFKNITFLLKLTKFKHIGLFPEQAANWNLIQSFLKPEMKMLNLFAYTGAASLIGKHAGAEVTHVDSVKQIITWGKENMTASNLNSIRWIKEDAFKFVQREIKRNNTYDLIVMDPPAWGIGTNKEKWKIEIKLENLIKNSFRLLANNGLLILNTYSPKVKLEELNNCGKKYFSKVKTYELWKKTNTKKELYYGNILRAIK